MMNICTMVRLYLIFSLLSPFYRLHIVLNWSSVEYTLTMNILIFSGGYIEGIAQPFETYDEGELCFMYTYIFFFFFFAPHSSVYLHTDDINNE